MGAPPADSPAVKLIDIEFTTGKRKGVFVNRWNSQPVDIAVAIVLEGLERGERQMVILKSVSTC